MGWSIRAAPHLHRRTDLPPIAAALFPLSEADAYARMGSWAGALAKSGISGTEALRETADVVASVVTKPTPKGEASRMVTERIRPQLNRWCPGCRATHVFEDLFRYAALQAGITLALGVSPITLVPMVDWTGPAQTHDGVENLVKAYLRTHGPAGPDEVAAFLGTKPKEIRPAWPDDLTEVLLTGKKAWMLPDQMEVLTGPPAPPPVRLLPPSDPYLQSRDRLLLVSDGERRSEIWKSIGSPGVVLIGTEIEGTWRPRTTGKLRLMVVSPFEDLDSEARSEIRREAERVAIVRGQRLDRVEWGA